MQEANMREKLEKIIKAYEELQVRMGDPEVLGNQKEYNRLAKSTRTRVRSLPRPALTSKPKTILLRPKKCWRIPI